MAWQYVIIALVITACLFYIAHRLRRTIRSAGDPCSGCSGCALHDQMVKKHGRAKKIRQCPNKKV